MPSSEPTESPSPAPSTSPSQSPTRYPISISDFNVSAVIAFFEITGWTDAEISEVNKDWESFISSLKEYLHQGFDADSELEFRYILVNFTSVNHHSLDELAQTDEDSMDIMLSQIIEDGMWLQYVIKCSEYIHCAYIATIDPSQGMNISAFEQFMSDKVDGLFVNITNITNGSADPTLLFKVENVIFLSDETNGDSMLLGIPWADMWIIVGILATLLCGILMGVYCIYSKYCVRKHSQ